MPPRLELDTVRVARIDELVWAYPRRRLAAGSFGFGTIRPAAESTS